MELKDLSKKQRKELLSIKPLLHLYGYEEKADMCDDKPDICLPSLRYRRIGIEVTEYTIPNDEEDFEAFRSILLDYIVNISGRKQNEVMQKYSKEKEYRLSVWLYGGLFPRIPSIKKKKEQIFKELDTFAFPQQKCLNNQYIASLEIEEISNSQITESNVRILYIEPFSYIDEKLLQKHIIIKENKLRAYKTEDRNKTIREYWLAITISDPIQVDLRYFQLQNRIVSQYDKIFLIKGIDCIQIK